MASPPMSALPSQLGPALPLRPDLSVGRERRVLLLLATIVVMSLADLHMTLEQLTSFGLLEGNPLARSIISYNSPVILAAWKLATVAMTTGILFWFRRRRSGEVAAWVCWLVLAALMVQWLRYSHEIPSLTAELNHMSTLGDHRWVAMTPEG